MGLPFRQLADMAFGIALQLAPEAFVEARVQLNPTHVTDPVTETTVTTWGIDVTFEQLGYEGSAQRATDEDPETHFRKWLFPTSRLGPTAILDENGIVTEGELQWNCYKVEFDPAKGLAILHTRR